jgi:glycosyltransferase involved in cell wall biosynthesis
MAAGDEVMHSVPRGGTLHVAAGLSEPVFGVLGQAAQLLREWGVPQTVVLIDRPEHAHRVPRLAGAAHLVPVTRARFRHWLALRDAVREQLRVQQPSAVHFHGTLAWLCTLGLVRDVRVLPSPREAVVDESFLRAPRREAGRPLVVSGCHRPNRKALEAFCSTAVIFGAHELEIDFQWCGPAPWLALPQLDAAGVGVVSAPGDGLLLPYLRSAWVFVAGAASDVPLRLAQAMACGVPCLAVDVPAHRELIEDGRTGLLFRSEEEAHQLLTTLLDDAPLRRRLGQAARCVAWERFSPQRLRADMMALYAKAGLRSASVASGDRG